MSDNNNQSAAWCDLFLSSGSSFQGFVDSKDQLEQLKWSFEVETKTCFVAVKTSTNFGNTDITNKQHKIQWSDRHDNGFPDHPYVIVSTERYECHHGPDRNKAKKEKAKTAQQGDHDTYQKRRFHIQMTKKMNCPAAIIAKELFFFTEHQGSVSKYRREQVSKEIKKKLAEKDITLQVQRQIFVTLPTGHENHLPGEVAEISLPVDKRVIAKVEEYVSEGFMSSSCIRSLIEQFVRRDIFSGQRCPSWTNRRFFPTQKDISNIIYAAKMKAMKSKYDQENLQANIADWKRERPEDRFEFSATELNVDAEESESSSGFFFLYQSSWQRRLLSLYGNELCLLDATYRTTKYSIPLFFLCVKTNVDYSVVAVFACQSENSQTIAKALGLIKKWNPEWNPCYFMVDHCEAELNAIATCFPECQSLICDFHREQAWGRWLKASKHGLSKNIDDILPLLRRIARATAQNDYDSAIINLKEHLFWRNHKEFRDWFTNTWLKNVQKWAWIHRKDRLLVNINTNNGVERQNRTLKYDFLTKYIDRTLTGMLTTVIKRYLPDQYRKYLDVNIKASSYFKRYNENLPLFLHNRPREFVDHCRKRLMTADEVKDKVIAGEGIFTVQSFTDPHTMYEVTLGTDTEVPSCQCHDWKHSHWPCKHMLAVVMHSPGYSWNDLAEHYRNNAMFVLDQLCLNDIGFKVPKENDVSQESNEEEEEPINGTVETDLPLKTEDTEAKDLRKAIREELEMIKAFTYLEIPANIQERVLDDILMVKDILNKAVPSENQLPLLENKQTVKSSYRSPFNIIKRKPKLALGYASTKRRKYKELPNRRRKKVVKERNMQKVPLNRDGEQQNFADVVMDNLISGSTCLEETPNLDDHRRKRNSEAVQATLPDHIIPEKKIKLSSPVSSPTEDEHGPQHITISGIEEIISGTDHLQQPVGQARNKLKLNFRGQRPSTKCVKGARKFKRKVQIVEKTQIVKKIQILPLMKEFTKDLTKQQWNNKVIKAKYKSGIGGRRAGGVLELAEEEPGDLINALVSTLPFKLEEDCFVSLLFQLLADMVEEGIVKLDIDPKKTEEDGEREFADLIRIVKESSKTLTNEILLRGGFLQSMCNQHVTHASPNCSLSSGSSEKCNDVCHVSVDVEEVFMEELREEGILEKKSSYMLKKNKDFRYEVCGEILEGKDMQSLEGGKWLNDKVINAYMGILKQEQNLERDGHIFVIQSYMAVLWQSKNFETWFFKKVQMSRYTWIFMPINKNGNHWILLAANVPQRTVSILDSMGGTNDRYVNCWRTYMKKRSQVVQDLDGEWKVGHITSARQKDGHSCGPFVLMNALALSKGMEPYQLSQKSATLMRHFVTNKIITNAKKPKAQRMICDMLKCRRPTDKKATWIQCEVCGRWLHFVCINIKETPENDYVCVVCNAQYE